VTSFITLDMATLPLKARNRVLLFVFCGQKNLVQMPFTLRCVHAVHDDKYFTRPAILNHHSLLCQMAAQKQEKTQQ